MASEYTKHYYIEGQRIASKIGGGLAPSITTYDDETELITGSYKSVSASLLNMCHRADNCTGFDTNYIKYGTPLVCLERLSTQDSIELDLYFYHSDHIGSSSFITDRTGIASQHLQYLPFGELFVEQRSTANYYTPYKFSGKEKDEETSYSYFGARYYMSDVSVWLSVDPMRDKYPYQSPYTYCGWNPVMIVDPDGRDEYVTDEVSGKTTKTVNDSPTNSYYLKRSDGTKVSLGTYDKTDNGLVSLSNSTSFYTYVFPSKKRNYLPADAAAGFLSASYMFHQNMGRKVKVNQFMGSDWWHSYGVVKTTCIDVQYIGISSNTVQPDIRDDNVDVVKTKILMGYLGKYGFSGMPQNYNILTSNKDNQWNPAISGTHGWEGHFDHFHVQNFNQKFIKHSPVKEKEHDCNFQY